MYFSGKIFRRGCNFCKYLVRAPHILLSLRESIWTCTVYYFFLCCPHIISYLFVWCRNQSRHTDNQPFMYNLQCSAHANGTQIYIRNDQNKRKFLFYTFLLFSSHLFGWKWHRNRFKYNRTVWRIFINIQTVLK